MFVRGQTKSKQAHTPNNCQNNSLFTFVKRALSFLQGKKDVIRVRIYPSPNSTRHCSSMLKAVCKVAFNRISSLKRGAFDKQLQLLKAKLQSLRKRNRYIYNGPQFFFVLPFRARRPRKFTESGGNHSSHYATLQWVFTAIVVSFKVAVM